MIKITCFSPWFEQIKCVLVPNKYVFARQLLKLIFFVEGTGFVYGFISFMYKIFSGVTLMLIQNAMPEPVESAPIFFQYALVYVCGGASIVGLITISCIWTMAIGQR